MNNPKIEDLFFKKGFTPNENQIKAISHTNGPLFLTAGPGSGKTRVLLWRTLNLIVFHGIKPEEIFLSTFTEKAALQLRDGLRSLLGLVTNITGQPYDISGMAIGTVHSICRKIITDRKFSNQSLRKTAPHLLDELGQYFKVYNRRFWIQMINAGGFDDEETAQRAINKYLSGTDNYSRHYAAVNTIRLFNRLSEENYHPSDSDVDSEDLTALLKMYKFYLDSLIQDERIKVADFALLQQYAYNTIQNASDTNVFKHIIIDEYQDTNTIQELIFFALANGTKNICVVGDDDQALYRFRGATVENLVEFEKRCLKYLKEKPTRIDLNVNYRSQKLMVDFYNDFITKCDWKKEKGKGHYRIVDKKISANRKDATPAVFKTKPKSPDSIYQEIAEFVHQLKETGKISDYNQAAFLFPSLQSMGIRNTRVDGFMRAFDALGIPVYAPRAGRFLEVEEASTTYGILFHIYGKPSMAGNASQGLRAFRTWILSSFNLAEEIIEKDTLLYAFIDERKQEIDRIMSDYNIFIQAIAKRGLSKASPLNPEMIRTLSELPGLSPFSKKNITNKYFVDFVKKRASEKNHLPIRYLINRATSLDRSILDTFYQIQAFDYFRMILEKAETGIDEGPICNLAMVSQFLARFMNDHSPIVNAEFLEGGKFVNVFVSSFTYAIFRLGETEYEDKEDPFPKGRVPFLTIHQSKGLEFPIVILGSPFRMERDPGMVEQIIRHLIDKEGEPIERISEFDNMRMFYVAFSRAKNLLVIPHYQGRGQRISSPLKEMLEENEIPLLNEIDFEKIPESTFEPEDLGKSYSYTADYMGYLRCPRQYMIFRKYGFETSRSQNMFFGNLVHKTIEDLHHFLISERTKKEAVK
jgi:DNA helicase II / ATP-dependent DNA helicase PcrA